MVFHYGIHVSWQTGLHVPLKKQSRMSHSHILAASVMVPNDPRRLGSTLESNDHVIFISAHLAQSMMLNAGPNPQQI